MLNEWQKIVLIGVVILFAVVTDSHRIRVNSDIRILKNKSYKIIKSIENIEKFIEYTKTHKHRYYDGKPLTP